MFGSKNINWANEPAIADSIRDLQTNILGVLANLIVKEQTSDNPDFSIIQTHFDEMDLIDQAASSTLYFKSQQEALLYIENLKVRLDQLLEDNDRDFNSVKPPYAFV